MKVQFYSTYEDFIDVIERTLERSGRASTYRQAEVWLVVVGLVWAYWIFFATQPAGAVAALVGGIIWGYFLCIKIGQINSRRQLRKAIKNQLNADGLYLVQVEINEYGLIFDDDEAPTLNRWLYITGIEDGPDAIYFFTRDNRVSAVRKRAFASPDELGQFLETARAYMSPGSLAAAKNPTEL